MVSCGISAKITFVLTPFGSCHTSFRRHDTQAQHLDLQRRTCSKLSATCVVDVGFCYRHGFALAWGMGKKRASTLEQVELIRSRLAPCSGKFKELGGERQAQTVSFCARLVSPARSGASRSGQKGGGNNTLVCARPRCGKSPLKDQRAWKMLRTFISTLK